MIASKIRNCGDSCVSLQLSAGIDPAANALCIALAAALEARHLRGVRDIVPTYNAVTIHFDPLTIDRAVLNAEFTKLAATLPSTTETGGRAIEIPVTYGGTAGPDLAAVAEFARCCEADVVRLHTGVRYRVYMLGFLPGFAYMGSVPRAIAMPRLETPRVRVAAGSVGIAGEQTGIYPCDTPGGWRIIGRTAATMFDAARSEPSLLRAGDYVTFVAA
jgi:KipI family sensor histidine kinase inhibitor